MGLCLVAENGGQFLLAPLLWSAGSGAFIKLPRPVYLTKSQGSLRPPVSIQVFLRFAPKPGNLALHAWLVAFVKRHAVENLVNRKAVQLFSNRLFADGFCLREACGSFIGHSKICIGKGVVGAQPQGLLARRNGFLQSAGYVIRV